MQSLVRCIAAALLLASLIGVPAYGRPLAPAQLEPQPVITPLVGEVELAGEDGQLAQLIQAQEVLGGEQVRTGTTASPSSSCRKRRSCRWVIRRR